MTTIPKSHPRYESLRIRDLITKAAKQGLVHDTGLIAHGRGEAYDYLLGEQTSSFSLEAEKTAAAALLIDKNPVLSINGNVAALSSKEMVRLGQSIPAKLEINLFHPSKKRKQLISQRLQNQGAKKVYGLKEDACIPGLDQDRAICDTEGIFTSDVVLVPLEDGDRCQALTAIGKRVIVIDLNPLSRSAQTASITIVDNVIRAIPSITKFVNELKSVKKETLNNIVKSWDNKKYLHDILVFISKRLNSIEP